METLISNKYCVKGPISPSPKITFYIVTDDNGFNIQLIDGISNIIKS